MRSRQHRVISRRQAYLAKGVLAAKQGALAIGALAAMNGAAHAGSNSATLSIAATITAQCFISNASLGFGAFGVFTPTSSATALTQFTATASASVPIACTNAWPATFYAAASSATLTGTTVSNTLVANLYTNAADTTAFPTSAASGIVYTGAGTQGVQNIYGQIITAATTKVDTYTGTVLLTIGY